MKELHLWADAKAAARATDPAQTNWEPDSRTITVTAADKREAWAIYSQQHPEIEGREPTSTSIAGKDLASLQRYVAQNRYNATIDVAAHGSKVDGLTPKVLKSLLVEESDFNPDVGSNSGGYTGIAQLSPEVATDAGLKVSGAVGDRTNPLKAIPAAAHALADKQRYMNGLYKEYGVSKADRVEFTIAAYNFGEGSMGEAMSAAFRAGRDPSKFHELFEPSTAPQESGIWKAAEAGHMDPAEKYVEVGGYAPEVMKRADQTTHP